MGEVEGCWGFGPPVWPKNLKNKTPGVFFQAAFDFDAARPQDTAQKWKNYKKMDFRKSRFSKINEKLI